MDFQVHVCINESMSVNKKILVELIEVEADNEEQAETKVLKLFGQENSAYRRIMCTSIFPNSYKLFDFCVCAETINVDKNDGYDGPGCKFSFKIKAPNIDEAKIIAKKEAHFRMGGYEHLSKVTVFSL